MIAFFAESGLGDTHTSLIDIFNDRKLTHFCKWRMSVKLLYISITLNMFKTVM